MCFDFSSMTRAYYDYLNAVARDVIDRESLEEGIERISAEGGLTPYYHVNAYTRPKVLGFEEEQGVLKAKVLEWGLRPPPSRFSKFDGTKGFPNARGETVFSLESFREAAKNRRVIIPLDGFYEYHHRNKTAYPFYITRNDGGVILNGGIANLWVDEETGEEIDTFSMVTCKANDIMSVIHNKPASSHEPRMPLLLDQQDSWVWLDKGASKETVKELIRPYSGILDYHPVEKLRGYASLGNVPEARQEKDWGVEILS